MVVERNEEGNAGRESLYKYGREIWSFGFDRRVGLLSTKSLPAPSQSK